MFFNLPLPLPFLSLLLYLARFFRLSALSALSFAVLLFSPRSDRDGASSSEQTELP